MEPYDLIIKGGTLIDPGQHLNKQDLDLAVKDGIIQRTAAAMDAPARQILDATGCLVVPGLIDLHTHVYTGVTNLSIDADSYALQDGITTLLDCGSAGAAVFSGFRQYVARPARSRVLAAVNISTIGLIDQPEGGYTPFLDSNRLYDCLVNNPDLAVAVKVRASRNALGESGSIEAVWMAREAAEAAGVPLIAHLGEPPPAYEQILDALRPGDILTHCFRKGPMHCPIDRHGKIKTAVQKARERGILFDLGHGSGSFSWRTARYMMEQGFIPDLISTDAHTGSRKTPIQITMTNVMSKMLHLGMSLPDVIRASTLEPARSIGWEDRIGSLAAGKIADIAVLRLIPGQFPLTDSHGQAENVGKRLQAVYTIAGGQVFRCQDQ